MVLGRSFCFVPSLPTSFCRRGFARKWTTVCGKVEWTYLWSLVETDHASAFLFQVLNHKLYKSRVEFDTAIDQVLAEFSADIVCLAGFMRILSGPFVRKWNGEWEQPGAALRGLMQVHLAVSWPGDPRGVFTGH